MSAIDDINSGKRWLLHHEDEQEPDGYRLYVLVEGRKEKVPLGEISNMPGSKPPLFQPTKLEAASFCAAFNSKRGINPEEAIKILATTM
ncbi:hypothetical protein [Bremerella sp. P1]|uniref:hypothetical protein n=1 Tax=Bremerella sp. P1 TaxID=3026424 RepID=UPI002368079A|nr:hypothetical protein [Bremerella sp. P1]WDI41812.1 hypothetical protein PSR63_25505 [Bremerella sp. P1]